MKAPSGTVHRHDGTEVTIRFVDVPGSHGRDHRAVTGDGQPLTLRPGDTVTIHHRVPGHAYLLADKVTGRQRYRPTNPIVAGRLPAPRVVLEPVRSVAT